MIIFHHIPKTAGTSFTDEVFDKNKNKSLIVGKEGLRALDNLNINDYEFIGGHLKYTDVLNLIKSEAIHISIIRDPLLRIISYFEMAYRDDEIFRDQICSINKWGFGFDVFYDRFIVKAGLLNLACSYFSSRKYFYDAVVSISNNFSLVGEISKIYEFEEYFTTIIENKSSLICPKNYSQKNKSSKGESVIDKISPKTLERIRVDNDQDFLLHEWLMKKHNGFFFNTLIK